LIKHYNVLFNIKSADSNKKKLKSGQQPRTYWYFSCFN